MYLKTLVNKKKINLLYLHDWIPLEESEKIVISL